MTKLLPILLLLLSVSSFASTRVKAVGESVPFLVVESKSIEGCQKKLSELTKKLKNKVILEKIKCGIDHKASHDYQVVYAGSILFY